MTDSAVVPTTVRVRIRPGKASGAKCLAASGPRGGLNFQDGGQAVGFAFDAVYGEEVNQASVFKDLAFVVDAALAGYNGAVLAYGQTGAGKTHTLFGNVTDAQERGVVPRAIQHLGQGIAGAASSQGAMFKVTVSIVEIYCERIRCLLPGGSGSAGRDNLQVKTDPVRGVVVEGATEVEVFGEDELAHLMSQGLAGRSVAATHMNAESSRSHCVVTIRVEQSLPSGEARLGKLMLVDLAGSERAGKTGAQGTTLAEGALINKSLSCLANVIYALTEAPTAGGAARHVPYRDSKLTRLLQDSLGSTARTVLICCCSPDTDNAAETLSTLRFGARAKGLTCKLQVNQRLSAERLQQMLAEERAGQQALVTRVDRLKACLTAAGLDMPEEEEEEAAPLARPAPANSTPLDLSPSGSAYQDTPTADTKRAALPTLLHRLPVLRAKVGWGGVQVVDVGVWALMLLSLMGYFVVEDMWVRSVQSRCG